MRQRRDMIEEVEIGAGVESGAAHDFDPCRKIPAYGIMSEKGIFSMGEIESWFGECRRDFPWRKDRTPYRVWISEVMLQQTRASVVIPYFLRWMELFPNVKALYMAPIEQVIKAWEGLGYYSRARNLHRAAKQIVEEFGGEIPDTIEALRSIRGFGPYTAGAVLSFGFQKRAAAVDGNVLRVISRYFLIEENVCRPRVRQTIEEKAESLLDVREPWVTAEALIELGATVCTPKPRCEDCPLKKGCLALQRGVAEDLPIKNIEKRSIPLHRTVLVIEHEGALLVKKGEAGKVMADLYEFPYFDKVKGGRKEVLECGEAFLGEEVKWVRKLPDLSHTFTKYKAHLFPVWVRSASRPEIYGCEWISISRLEEFPFSSGHRRIAAEVVSLSFGLLPESAAMVAAPSVHAENI